MLVVFEEGVQFENFSVLLAYVDLPGEEFHVVHVVIELLIVLVVVPAYYRNPVV